MHLFDAVNWSPHDIPLPSTCWESANAIVDVISRADESFPEEGTPW